MTFWLTIVTAMAMWSAARVTLMYARRPDGVIYPVQPVLPDGKSTFTDPNRPGVVVDVHGYPVAGPPERPAETPLWRVWAQVFLVAEVAGAIIVGLLTGWFAR